MSRPSIAELLNASGHTAYTLDLVMRAVYSLYGNIGAGLDERDWSALMRSADPLAASEQALLAMYQDSGYLQRNANHLVSLGYVPAQAEITYRQMYDRLGLTYQAGWSVGTSYENLGHLTMPELVALVLPPPPLPTLGIDHSASGLVIQLNVGGQVGLSVSGSLGNFLAGDAILVQQGSIKEGYLSLSANGRTSEATSQYVVLGTGGHDVIDTSSAGSRVDFIFGGDGNDVLTAGPGDDVIQGGAGEDILNGGWGADTLYGGDGDDRFIYPVDAQLRSGTGLADRIDGGAGTNTLVIGNNVGTQYAFEIPSTMSWARMSNVSRLEAVGPQMAGFYLTLGDGAYESGLREVDLSPDTETSGLNANFVNVSAETGTGNGYFLRGSAGVDYLTGGAGPDTIAGGGGADKMLGRGGNDVFVFSADVPGGARINGGSTEYGEVNSIRIDASANLTNLLATNADGSANTLSSLFGDGAINQVLLNGTDAVVTFQGSFLDSQPINFAKTSPTDSSDVVINVSAGASLNFGALRFQGTFRASMHYSLSESNTFTFNVVGGAAPVTLVATSIRDIINGGDGADTLTGGGAADTLTGGAGNDRFTFNATYGESSDSNINTGVDAITDLAAGDVIVVNLSQVGSFDARSVSDDPAVESFIFTGAWAGGNLLMIKETKGLGTAADDAPGSLRIDIGNYSSAAAAAQVEYHITGTEGADTIVGGSRDDVINGGTGADTLCGGAGSDTLTGEVDADTFSFLPGDGASTSAAAVAAANGTDTITDFNTYDGDRLGLGALLSGTMVFATGDALTLSSALDACNIVVITDTQGGVSRLTAAQVDALAASVSGLDDRGFLVFNNKDTIEIWYDMDMNTDNGGTDVALIGTLTMEGGAAALALLTEAHFV